MTKSCVLAWALTIWKSLGELLSKRQALFFVVKRQFFMEMLEVWLTSSTDIFQRTSTTRRDTSWAHSSRPSETSFWRPLEPAVTFTHMDLSEFKVVGPLDQTDLTFSPQKK